MTKLIMANQIKNSSNKGFSLVEIIVAIAILAVIVLPLLNAFVTSSKLNARSKDKLMAVETAKNIMEEMRGYKLNEIAKLAESSAFSNDDFKELDYDSHNNFVLAAEKSLRPNLTTGKYEFYPKKNGKYYYYLQNIMQDDYAVNALITVSTSSISTGNISKLTPIDTKKDILIDNTTTAKDVVDAVKSDAAIPPSIASTVQESNIRRETYITVGDSGNSNVHTEFKYFTGNRPLNIINDIKTESNDAPKDELRSVYLFFEPWIHSTMEEKIVVKNPFNKKFNLYIVKQETNSLDNSRAAIEIKDGNVNTTDKSAVKIFTNMPESSFTYGYTRNGIIADPGLVDVQTTLIENKSSDEVNSLARVYDIEVKIFNSDVDINNIVNAKPLVTLTGGMSN